MNIPVFSICSPVDGLLFLGVGFCAAIATVEHVYWNTGPRASLGLYLGVEKGICMFNFMG